MYPGAVRVIYALICEVAMSLELYRAEVALIEIRVVKYLFSRPDVILILPNSNDHAKVVSNQCQDGFSVPTPCIQCLAAATLRFSTGLPTYSPVHLYSIARRSAVRCVSRVLRSLILSETSLRQSQNGMS